jgi:hypothetical protein
VYRAVAALVSIFLLVLISGERGAYAGLARAQASGLATQAARSMREGVFAADTYAEPRRRVLAGVFPSRNSRGAEAWLAIFRLRGDVNDPDQACVWVWRTTGLPYRYGFEETPSVAYGSGDPVHERCVEEVLSRGIADREQTVGVEMPEPPFSRPDVVTPFGPRPSSAYPTDLVDGTALSLTGIGIQLPDGSAPGTCGFAGFVVDQRSGRVVPGATVTLAASRPWSGISDAPTIGSAVSTTISDTLGGFAFVDFPTAALGFDITITASGYGISRVVHQYCFEGDFAVGDWVLGRRSHFEDATPYPVAR